MKDDDYRKYDRNSEEDQDEHRRNLEREFRDCPQGIPSVDRPQLPSLPSLYSWYDYIHLQMGSPPRSTSATYVRTLDELLDKDKEREKDGFPRRIRIGRIVRPSKDRKDKIVIVPTTDEPKFLHDDAVTEEESTGGSGEGEEGEVIGEEQVQPMEGGDGQGAGQGEGAEHDVTSDAFDLGKILTEKFQLPNLKTKGKKTVADEIQV